MKTVGELIEALKQYPEDMPLIVSDADSGGYDVCDHLGVTLSVIEPEEGEYSSHKDEVIINMLFGKPALRLHGDGELFDHPILRKASEEYIKRLRARNFSE